MAYTVILHGELEDKRDGDGLADHRTVAAVVEIDNGGTLSAKDLASLEDTFERRCYCSHDCCGHQNGGVLSISKIWDGRYIVLASYALDI